MLHIASHCHWTQDGHRPIRCLIPHNKSTGPCGAIICGECGTELWGCYNIPEEATLDELLQ